jgi:hypothetical protein
LQLAIKSPTDHKKSIEYAVPPKLHPKLAQKQADAKVDPANRQEDEKK